MPSLVSGYSYDIFISYRQKDNQYDGWVTEFVENLRKELEATFKDNLTIYFDQNAGDGLHETHDVDDSLKEKVRCLILIPIISHTYCDPNCFAWRNEFLAFKQLASDDALGLKVKLPGGNVSSRILPIVIHQIDREDKTLLEGELGPIRSIDFVFSSSGVNRPLRAKDDELSQQGQRQLLYRDQVNKVANAVKGIIGAIRNPGAPVPSGGKEAAVDNRKVPRWRGFAIAGALFLLFASLGYYFRETRDQGPVSIAVLPFVDMSQNQDQEWFTDGLSDELINLLTRVPTIEVKARTSSFAFKGKNEDIQLIAEKLKATHVLEGSVRVMGDRIKVTAQLIHAADGNHIWSETFERSSGDIFAIQDDIATAVVKALSKTLFSEVPEFNSRPIDLLAVNFYLQGRYNTVHHNTGVAIQNYRAALRIDSVYVKAWAGLAWAYSTMRPTDSLSEKQILKKRERFARTAMRLDPQDPDAMRAMMQFYYGVWKWKEYETLAEQAMMIHPNNAEVIFFGSYFRYCLHRDNASALQAISKAVQIDPLNYLYHVFLGEAYINTGDLDKAEASIRTALSLGRDVPGVMDKMAQVYFAKRDYETALAYLDSMDPKKTEPWTRFPSLYAMGRKAEANRLLDSLRVTIGPFAPGLIAGCYAYKGSYDSAFLYLKQAMKDSSEMLVFVAIDPSVPEGFRKDPRFKELVDFLQIPK